MLDYVRRGTENPAPIGDLPLWLSELLRNRGVDTPEKAERFLHPDLSHLHDPFLMQGMDKAVRIIREEVAAGSPIIVYGDYDVDGVSAASIMLETLREMGADPAFRIPSRHGEGYGLNCDAVRWMAERYRLLITVDCGVTNHDEVRLAQMLGMTVIVTDHHQLADTPSPADVVLNPLMGDYPFRRLCGAGVALKLTQALLGMEAVMRRIDLAALATVADIVPLVDENRVIVREGLKRMANTARPGLAALMQVSDVQPPVNSGHVGFRLAPRLNAGGRLEDAAHGVLLLTTRDGQEALEIAQRLEKRNQERQAIEQEIIAAAMSMIPECVDFLTDRVIIIAGENWNHGVIGLAAGRICEKFHYPTIVLTVSDGVAVGSCRSIRGVNIHAMLSTCKDLFTRFGGHEQAAGLTMPAELIPELRRRMNLAIREQCDPQCYIPKKEYDVELHLRDADLEMIERLEMLQPTGFCNPNPVFRVQDAHVQEARRVGKTLAHLQLTLLEQDEAPRKGIAFGMGDLAETGLERVDVLFTPSRNEYRGQVTAQLHVEALRPAACAVSLPDEDALFRPLLQEIAALAANDNKIGPDVPVEKLHAVLKLLEQGRGVLLIGHERGMAAQLLSEVRGREKLRLDTAVGEARDPRGFNTLLLGLDLERLRDIWAHIVLIDGDLLPGEAAAIAAKCPRAQLHQLRMNETLTALLRSLLMDRGVLAELYRYLRGRDVRSPHQAGEATGLTASQALTGMLAFQQAKLASLTMLPFEVKILPVAQGTRSNPLDTPLMRYLASAAR